MNEGKYYPLGMVSRAEVGVRSTVGSQDILIRDGVVDQNVDRAKTLERLVDELDPIVIHPTSQGSATTSTPASSQSRFVSINFDSVREQMARFAPSSAKRMA